MASSSIRYVPAPEHAVYTEIMNSKGVQDLLLAKARAVEQSAIAKGDSMGGVERTHLTFYSDVRPGLHRAHARVTGKLPNPHSYRQHYHNKKWGRILAEILQESLDSARGVD